MTPVEERILAGIPVPFHEALFDCCMHGELTEEMARDWLDGEDLALALRVIRSGLFMERSPQMRAWLDEHAK